MKKTLLFILLLVLGFYNFAFCSSITNLSNKELGIFDPDWVSLNSNGDQALVTFQDKGLWIVGVNSTKKIADAPAKMGTWSPMDKLIAYVKDKDLVIVDSIGNIKKELDLGLRWVDSIAWLKNEKTIYMFEGPDEFYYRLLKIDLITGKFDVVLPENGNRLQLRINRANENEVFFKNNRYPGEIPEDCSLGKYNLKTKVIVPDVLKGVTYSIHSYFDVSPDGNRLILPSYITGQDTVTVLNLKKRTKKQVDINMDDFYAFSFNISGSKIVFMLPSKLDSQIKVIDGNLLK